MADRYRVLLIAEAANPEWVSVPLVGWSMANAMRAFADVHIVTQVRNAGAFARAGLVEGRDFTAIDTERVARPAYRMAERLRGGSGKGWTMVTAISSLIYPYFERLVWRRFGEAIRRGNYDLVHRVTPLTPTTGSSLAARCQRAGVPFVMGPLNGGLPWPKAFERERRKEKEWLSYIRGAYKLFPGRNRTLAAASVIVAGSRHTAAEIPAKYAGKVVYMPENGIDPTRFTRTASPMKEVPLRLCFIGRLVPYKGADMAIEAALQLLASGRATLDIVGDGPMRGELEAQVDAAGLGGRVRFHGWVPHDEVQRYACDATVFVFPSIREFGGGAVLEAMALGLVPVIVDYGGPGELVTAERGVAVPIGSRTEIVEAVRAALERLAADPALVNALGAAARSWTLGHMTWSAKARAMIDIYGWALGRRSKPQPF